MDEINIMVHEDMGDVSERFYGFTARQWIFGILTALIVVPTYIYGKDYIGEDLASWIVIIVAIPIVFIGFVPIQGLKAEKILPYWWRNYMAFYKPLEYKTEQEILNEKKNGKKKQKTKSASRKKKKNKTVSFNEESGSKENKQFFDILVTPEIVRMENSVSCLIHVPNSNGQYMYLQKSKLIRMGQELLLARIFKEDGEIFTYDKDGNFVGNVEYEVLKEKFDK